MIANAPVLKQQVEIKRAQPADLRVAIEVYKRMLAQKWAGYFVTVAAPACIATKDAFDAVRHDANQLRSTNLSVTEPEEGFIVLRAATAQEEAFRGRRGKLTVIRK